MIAALAYFGAALWFSGYVVRLLYIAATRGYVMALTRPISDTVETPQTRTGNPQKFWANVAAASLLLPLALASLWFSATHLYEAFNLQAI